MADKRPQQLSLDDIDAKLGCIDLSKDESIDQEFSNF